MSHDAPASHCRNCQHDLQALPDAHYCPQCGQETVLHPPTLWEFVHEFITHYVALEGALWRSLGALLLRPGKLTREYFHGRRKHYVLPLRLYLSASFVFFLFLKVSSGGHAPDEHLRADTEATVSQPAATAASASPSASPSASASESASASANADASTAARDNDHVHDNDRYLACAEAGARCSWWDRGVGKFISKSRKADEAGIDWQPRITAAAPYAIFLMLPVFAGLLQLVYWGRRMPYGEHFVFSLHLHSFWFLALLLLELLPDALNILPLLAIPLYGCWALRHVYVGRWAPTLARATVLSLVYGVLLTCGAAVLAVWVILAS